MQDDIARIALNMLPEPVRDRIIKAAKIEALRDVKEYYTLNWGNGFSNFEIWLRNRIKELEAGK